MLLPTSVVEFFLGRFIIGAIASLYLKIILGLTPPLLLAQERTCIFLEYFFPKDRRGQTSIVLDMVLYLIGQNDIAKILPHGIWWVFWGVFFLGGGGGGARTKQKGGYLLLVSIVRPQKS